MRRFGAKLAFVHRKLWGNSGAYRYAVLLGPPPLLGFLLASAFVWAFHFLTASAPAAAKDGSDGIPWARWIQPTETAQPAEEKLMALPPADSAGRYPGFEPGWFGSLHALTVDATMDADVDKTSIANFSQVGAVISGARLMQDGPPAGLFVAGIRGMFVVRTPGEYSFSVRLNRVGALAATCMLRLGVGHRSVVRQIILNVADETTLPNVPVSFAMQPGLLPMAVVAGCWRGERPTGLGDITLLVRPPGAAAPRPILATEMIRPL